MNEDKITSYVDRQGVTSDTDFVIAEINRTYDAFKKVKELNISIQSKGSTKEVMTGITELSTRMDDLERKTVDLVTGNRDYIKSTRETAQSNSTAASSYEDLLLSISKNKIALKEISGERKKLNEDLKAGRISTDEYEKSLASIIDRETQLKLSGGELVKTLKSIQKEAMASDGSIDQMEARLAQLQQTFERFSPADQVSPAGKEIQKQASELAKTINDQKKTLGDFSKNVGRYADSLKPLFKNVADEISKLELKQKELTQTYQNLNDQQRVTVHGFNLAAQIQATADSIDILTKSQQSSFKVGQSYNGALNQLTDSFKQMVVSGNFSQEFLDEFQKHLATSKREANEVTKSIKAIGSETRGLDLATGAINTMASVFQTAAGASALFGQNNKDAEKTIQRLVAFQSVANGIKEIGTQLTNKETVAGKAYTFVQKQIAVITNASATATQKWSAALKLTGIGLLITGITYLISKLDIFGESQKSSAESTRELTESIKGQNDAIQDNINLLKDDADALITNAKKQLELAQASGKGQVEIFALKRKLAEEEKKLSDRQLAAQIARAEKEDVNVTNGIKGMKALENAAETYRIFTESANNNIIYLEQQKQAALLKSKNSQADDIQEQIDQKRTELSTYKALYADFNGALKNSTEVQSNLEKLAADEGKFNADERRKLVLETARIEINDQIYKNEAILSNERSTLQERLKAIRDNAEQRKGLARAELNSVLSDPGKSAADRLIAEKNFNSSKKKIDTDAKTDEAKINEVFRLRDLQAQTEYKNRLLQAYAEINHELASTEQLSFEERLKAQDRFVKAQTEIAINAFRLQLAQAGYSNKEIQIIEAGNKKLLGLEKTKFNELEALEVDHETKLLEITSAGASAINAVISIELDKQRAIREKGFTELEELASGIDFSNSKEFADEIVALNNSLRQKKISRDKYERDRAAIENKYNAQALENTVKFLEEEMELVNKYKPEETLGDAERRLQATKALLGVQTGESEKKQLAEKVARLEKEYQLAKDLVDKKKELENSYVEAVKSASDAVVKTDDDTAAKRLENLREFGKTLELTHQYAQEAFNLIGGLLSASAEREKNRIQEQIDLLEEKRQKDIDVANQSITNEADKAAAIAVINARADAQKKILEQRQRQADRKRAEFEKGVSIANIILSTAVAVIKALTEGDPYTKIPRSIAAGAIGAAQLAVAIATPIPKYKHGKNLDDYEGPAIVGDGGKKELIIRGDGTSEVTPSKPTLTYVGRKDLIFPDASKYLTGLAMQQTDKVLYYRNRKDYMDLNTMDTAKLERKMDVQNSLLRTISEKRELHLSSSEAGLEAMWKYGANRIRYTDEQTNW